MPEPTTKDPTPSDGWCHSSRDYFDVLTGDDVAAPLIQTSSSGDLGALEHMLDQDGWADILLRRSQCVYRSRRPKTHADDVREVRALTMSNLSRAVIGATTGGHSEVIAKLLHFASQHNVQWTDVIDNDTIETTIQRGHAEIFKLLATFAPEIVLYDLPHYGRPLDKAISKSHVALTAVILELGGGGDYGAPPWMSPHILGGHLCIAVDERYDYKALSDLLLAHGYTIAGSGALHMAAERGHLNAMQYLLDRGADIDEILPAANLPYQQLLYSTWTPMHFAAGKGKADALHFLESKGARTDVLDKNGKTALQLLSEHDASSDAEPRHDHEIA